MTTTQVNSLQIAQEALDFRAANAIALGKDSLANKLRIERDKLNANNIKVMLECKVNLDSLVFSDAKNENHLGIYPLQKVIKITNALSQNNASLVDKYTASIIINALKGEGLISNRLQNASLSTSIECDVALDKRLHKGESTAPTQASSTRHALCYLNLASYDDATRTMKLLDNKQAKRFKALFVA